MAHLVQEGKVRAAGVSSRGPRKGTAIAESESGTPERERSAVGRRGTVPDQELELTPKAVETDQISARRAQ
jgi:hypothetical protein